MNEIHTSQDTILASLAIMVELPTRQAAIL